MHCHTCQTVEDVFKVVRDKEVSFIQIWFTDILGVMKSFAIRPSELEEAMTEGMGFDAGIPARRLVRDVEEIRTK